MRYHVHFRPVQGLESLSEWVIHEEGAEGIDEDTQDKACWVEAESPAKAKTAAKWVLFPAQMARAKEVLEANPEYRAWLQARGGAE